MEDDDKHTMHAHKQPPQATAGAPKAKNAAAVAQADAHMDDDSEDDSADDSVDNSAAAHVPLAVLSSPGTSLAGSKADKAHPTLPPDSATQPLKPATNRLSTDPAQHAQHAEESDDEDDEAAIALLKGSAAQARGGAGAGGGGSGGELEVVPRVCLLLTNAPCNSNDALIACAVFMRYRAQLFASVFIVNKVRRGFWQLPTACHVLSFLSNYLLSFYRAES